MFNKQTGHYEPRNMTDTHGTIATSKAQGPRSAFFEDDVTDRPNPHAEPTFDRHLSPDYPPPEPRRFSDGEMNRHPTAALAPETDALRTGSQDRPTGGSYSYYRRGDR